MTPVQKLYHLGHAQWYDPFRKFWTFFVEKQVEKDFFNELESFIMPKTRIVEIGCGTGINVQRLLSLHKPFASYTGIDFSPDMLAIAQKKFGNEKNITFIEGDAKTVLLPKSYDLALCSWVLSHISEPSAVVNRAYDNLEKGGLMLLVFLTKPAWYIAFWFTPMARLFHSTYVSKEEIKKMKGKKEIRIYASGVATFVVIHKG